ncbi:MAG: ABC transporter permease, partial [Oscillospiraceae bacterium]
MGISQSFRLAIKSLATSKMRALLTMLGIIIGVAAVIVIISLGDGMKNMINSEFDKMGSNLLQVELMGRGSNRAVSDEDLYSLAAEHPEYIAALSPSVSTHATVKQGTETSKSTTVTGVGEDYMTVKALELAQGRFIQYIDIMRLQKVCVIGSYVNQELFNDKGLGKTIQLSGNEYQIVGVLTEAAGNTSYGADNGIYIPYSNATRLNGNATISSYLFSAANEDVNDQA